MNINYNIQKVLILGGAGMLGHKAFQVFSREFDTWVTFQESYEKMQKINIFDQTKVFYKIDVFDFDAVKKVFESIRPSIVLNCIGIIKQLKDARNPKVSIYINSLFPHLLVDLCQTYSARLIHVSTDCVFSGKKGMYTEEDASDAEDLYGRSKYLGEVTYSPGLTLRTSIIGHELFTNVSLVDWFLSNKAGKVKGYTKAIYSGFPTVTFCHEVMRIVKNYPNLNGLLHISSDPISKFELLGLINDIYHCDITIERDDTFSCNRSLNSDKIRSYTEFRPKSWREMIVEMYEDHIKTQYKGKETS